MKSLGQALILTVFSLGVSTGLPSSAEAAPPDCKGPNKNNVGCGGDVGDGGDVVFEALLVGELDDFIYSPLPGRDSCILDDRNTEATVRLGEVDIDLSTTSIDQWQEDQVLGKGATIVNVNAEGFPVNFTGTAHTGPGGTNRVVVPGADGICEDSPRDPVAGRSVVRFFVGPAENCDGLGDSELCLTTYRAGIYLDDNKWAKCDDQPLRSPVALNLAGEAGDVTEFDLFVRCEIAQQGRGTVLGQLSWGKIVLTQQ